LFATDWCWPIPGVVYGVLASLFVALNAIYVKKILPIVDGDSWKYAARLAAQAHLLVPRSMLCELT
jgi:hypothetical protein